MDVLRTPDEQFEGLKGYDFEPNYHDITAADGTPLRIHYLDEGPRDGELILCLHGQPSWSYLYRKMIPLLTDAGFRVMAPDLIGFGRSDKPASMDDYAYQAHVDWMATWLTDLDLTDITLMCQDWGGLIGLRLAGEHTQRFKRLVIANTGLPSTKMISDDVSEMLGQMYPTLPVPDAAMVAEQFSAGAPGAFLYWVKYAAESPSFSVRDVFGMLSGVSDPAILDGYTAPFPNDDYIAGARKFPFLVPMRPEGKPDRLAGDKAWAALEAAKLPVLTAFSDGDPVTKGGEKAFMARLENVKNVTIKGGGHFLQEDTPEPLSREIISFMQTT
ncbi:MAG: haloalkane dehalogenase [Hyphomonadaceae bacterium]|nr:haloalkane dehalogenase [Hyphomonadaceae bacterium]